MTLLALHPIAWGLLAAAVVVAVGFVALGVLSRRPTRRPDAGPTLAPCPSTPNCVHSGAEPGSRAAIEPFALGDDADAAWRAFGAAVEALPRTTVVDRGDHWLHAESRSALFGFVDDLQAVRDDAAGRIDVRCAARVGTSDLGANRRRVEALRAAYEARRGG